MTNTLKKDFKEKWDTEEIRVLVLTSLVIQALLTFCAPQRKRSSKSYLKLLIWVLYLLADVVAMYTIGLISNHKGHSFTQGLDLLALWASFLLLHLGGPDTITALALEDNELWRRHALQLATQVTVTGYVFSRSLKDVNHLWLPTVLVFVDGFIKYFERTCALFFASRDNFRDSIMGDPEAGPNYARLMEEYFSAKSANIPARFEPKKDSEEGKEKIIDDEDGQNKNEGVRGSGGNGDDDRSVHSPVGSVTRKFKSESDKQDTMIREAHSLYEKYKPLLAEGFLSLKDRDHSRSILFSYSIDDAFSIIQIELNLIYDVFFTKSFLLQKRRAIARILCFAMVVVSLVLFSRACRFVSHKTDIIITLVLFSGAMALDISAAIMFVLSDWWLIAGRNRAPWIQRIMTKILNCSRPVRFTDSTRWSNTISKFNLLKYCFRQRPFVLRNKIFSYIFGIKNVTDILDENLYVITKPIEEKSKKEKRNEEETKKDEREDKEQNLIMFIKSEIWKKAELAGDKGVAREVFLARGNLVLEDDYYLVSECLRPWTLDLDYDESLMIWHLATDICYWNTQESDNHKFSDSTKKWRYFSKEISDYMLYLVIFQQSLLSSVVGMSETRLHDTVSEAKKFMNDFITVDWLKDFCSNKCCCCQACYSIESKENEFFNKFCKQALGVKAVVEPMVAKGDKSKSVLFDACRLAKQLEMFRNDQWEITAKVWLELLCYAAVRCAPRYHIAQLSKGGELITLVWLFMAHLGIGERFLQNQGFGLTKLVIGK